MTYLLTFLLLFQNPVAKHDFHVSIAEVNYNTSSRSFEVILQVFTDDLEKALRENYKLGQVYLDKTQKYDKYIERYVKANFYIRDAKKQKLNMIFLGKEIDNEDTLIYFEFPYKSSVKKLQLSNSILIDIFADQKNLVNTNYKGQKKTHKFQKGYTTTPYNLQ